MDQLHEMTSKLLDLAAELERTPTKHEFFNKYPKFYPELIRNYNERYTDFVLAAGLAPNREKKITNKIFEVSVEKITREYKEKKEDQQKNLVVEPYPSIAVISDIHFPFENSLVLKRFNEYVGDTKPEYVIVNGDAWDMYSHSKFARSHNIFTPKEEEYLSRTSNEQFWERIKLIHPEARCMQSMGNHDVRPMKRVLEVYPEAEDWIAEKLKKLFTFPGVETIFDPRQEIMLPGNIAVHHGYRSKLGEHRDYMLLNSINGHTHVGGTVFRKFHDRTYWELNSGLAGDPDAKGLSYRMQRMTNWTPGFGGVNKLGPHFIHC